MVTRQSVQHLSEQPQQKAADFPALEASTPGSGSLSMPYCAGKPCSSFSRIVKHINVLVQCGTVLLHARSHSVIMSVVSNIAGHYTHIHLVGEPGFHRIPRFRRARHPFGRARTVFVGHIHGELPVK